MGRAPQALEWAGGRRLRAVGGWLAVSGAHLCIASSAGGAGVMGGRLRGRNSKRAVRRPDEGAAPLAAAVGAKGWLVVSMCQIASVSLRAMSIWATLAPRWRPRWPARAAGTGPEGAIG